MLEPLCNLAKNYKQPKECNMLEGIKEKMLELLYDIEEEVGKESKLYVHAYDVYADLVLYNNSSKGNDLTSEIFNKEAQDGM